MRKLVCLLSVFILLAVLPAGAQQLSGDVIDAETGRPIPYASILYRDQQLGVASNHRGHYTIARHEGWALTFSAVGFQPYTVLIGEGYPAVLNVQLQPSAQALEGVTVTSKRHRYSRKNNPAVELMRKVIAAKKRNDLANRDYYQYNKYQKLTLAVNNISQKQLNSSFFKKKPWLADQVERCTYSDKLILPISVEETVSQQIYRKNPHHEKTLIKGINSTGINDFMQTGEILNTLMNDVFTDVDIYDDQIRLLRHMFTSPIGRDAISFYRFYIVDTLALERDSCIRLSFIPNNQQDFGFRGDLYVLKDSCYQVKRCEMTLPLNSDANFVKNMKIVQEFTRLADNSWVLTTDDMFTELVAMDFLTQFAVIRNNRLTDYSFDEISPQLLKGKKKLVRDADAMMRGDDFWQKYRQVELTKSEKSMGSFLQSIEQTGGFKYFLWVAKAFVENFVETSIDKDHPNKVDIGPVNTVITNNFIDGFRFRLSALTTANLNPHLFLSGYVAHGLDSKKNYYRGDLVWSFNKKEYLPREYPIRSLTFSSTYDVMSPSDKFMRTDKDNVFTALKWTQVDKMMFYNRQSLTFVREEDWGFRTTVSLKAEENEPVGSLSFVPLSETVSRKIRTTELFGELRFSPGETFLNTKQRRVPVNKNAPIFTLSHTLGLKNVLGGEYAYNFTEASIYKRFWLNSWGRADLRLKGGIQWSKVPFPLLIMPETNLSYIIQDYTFQLVNNMEFLSDRYASAMLNWDMNGKLLNRIPLLKKLKWRECFTVKCMWGDLTDKNNPTLAKNQGDALLMHFPETTYLLDPSKPYWEISVGFHNILKVLRVEYVRRLNYNELPTAHKHGVRLMLHLAF